MFQNTTDWYFGKYQFIGSGFLTGTFQWEALFWINQIGKVET